jgi:hypothetical protein
VTEDEVAQVLRAPIEDRAGREGSRVALGQTVAGRYLRVVYVLDVPPVSRVRRNRLRTGAEGKKSASQTAKEEVMNKNRYPKGWDLERVRRVLEHYDAQSDDEAVAEDEASFEPPAHTAMEVPVELVPEIRELIARRGM